MENQQEKSQLFNKNQIPPIFEQTVKAKWGNEIESSPARSNGRYSGPIIADDKFIAQKVSDKSVVFHNRESIDFSGSENLINRSKNNRLNDVQLSIQYEEKQAKAYFYDPQRANIHLMFNRIGKEAGEQLKGAELTKFSKNLESIKETMIKKHVEHKNEKFEKRTAGKSEPGKGAER